MRKLYPSDLTDAQWAKIEPLIPKPKPGSDQAKIQATEWGINRVRAPEVWNGFGIEVADRCHGLS